MTQSSTLYTSLMCHQQHHNQDRENFKSSALAPLTVQFWKCEWSSIFEAHSWQYRQ